MIKKFFDVSVDIPNFVIITFITLMRRCGKSSNFRCQLLLYCNNTKTKERTKKSIKNILQISVLRSAQICRMAQTGSVLYFVCENCHSEI